MLYLKICILIYFCPSRHAELLHFIAQKESKCLELRSQLAMHEAELLQRMCNWNAFWLYNLIHRHSEKKMGKNRKPGI